MTTIQRSETTLTSQSINVETAPPRPPSLLFSGVVLSLLIRLPGTFWESKSIVFIVHLRSSICERSNPSDRITKWKSSPKEHMSLLFLNIAHNCLSVTISAAWEFQPKQKLFILINYRALVGHPGIRQTMSGTQIRKLLFGYSLSSPGYIQPTIRVTKFGM